MEENLITQMSKVSKTWNLKLFLTEVFQTSSHQLLPTYLAQMV